jgi:hypothetical protein
LFSSFKAGLYVDVLWGFDTETDSIAADFQDRNLHFVSNYDFLVLLTADDQHLDILLLVYRSAAETEKYNRLSSHFCKGLFKIPDFSGTMPIARHEEVRCNHHRPDSVDLLAHDGPGHRRRIPRTASRAGSFAI